MKRLIPCLLPLVLLACKKELLCPQGEVDCRGACVSLTSDAANCGTCGLACGAQAVCAGGSCACAAGTTACGAACVVLASDPAHCGACDTACTGATPACSTDAGATACAAACTGGQVDCGGACVDTSSDRFHCGACGTACAAGQACRAGACHADLQVACGATSEVLPVTAELAPAGPGRAVTAGLGGLAISDDLLFTISGFPAAAVDLLSLDPTVAAPLHTVDVAGSTDLEGVAIHDHLAFVSNASVGAVDVISPTGVLLDEIPLADQQTAPNPHAIAFVGPRAFVALYGFGPGSGQGIGVLDFSGLAACAVPGATACGAGGGCGAGLHCVAGTCRPACGRYQKTIGLAGVAGAFDAPGLPFPSKALAVGDRVYVTLSNLKKPDPSSSFYFQPAGSGRLAVVDTARGDALSLVDLGPACGNPGGLALRGTTLWVACGSFSYATDWPGRVVPVEVGGAAPVVGTAIDVSAVVPNGVAFCGGQGYVPDQASGKVLRFDPTTGLAETPVDVCPVQGFAYVADLACAP